MPELKLIGNDIEMDGEKVAMPVLEKVLSIANVIDSPNVWSDEEENPSVRP